MLTLLLGTDWRANRDAVLSMVAADVERQEENCILLVPELVSHDMERRLCVAAGDTTSRFAEVLSFTRLTRRVSEYVNRSCLECLDNGGRVVAMASAVRQLRSKLKAYAAVETRPEFLSGLIDAVDEFKRCCISSADLIRASKLLEGNLAQKLEELALILEAYDAVCANGRRDPRDQMTWLLDQLNDSDFAQKHRFYLNGFPDFSRQNMAVVSHLITNAQSVTVSLTCDRLASGEMAFENAGATAFELYQIAKQNGIAVQVRFADPYSDPLSDVCGGLLQGRLPQNVASDILRILRTDSPYSECCAAAERVVELVVDGCRYRDIRIVCPDMKQYQAPIRMVFNRAGIPFYQSGTEEILEKTVIHTVLSAMDAALSGFEQKDVIRYLKSTLSPITLEQCDRIENYVLMWSIDRKLWTLDWQNHPEGLVEIWTERNKSDLERLNAARKRAIDPLVQLRSGFLEADTISQQVVALYRFFVDIQLEERLRSIAEEMDRSGDLRSAQILNQLWEILLNALEQLYDMLGSTAWDVETFTRLFKLLLSQYDVGTIPSVLDAVTVGSVSAMRCHQSPYLIVLGALEGSFPRYGTNAGVLSDLERAELQKLDIPLNSGTIDGLKTEFSEIYDVFRGADTAVSVLCPSGQPSFVYDRLKRMTGIEETPTALLGPALTNREEAGAFLARIRDESSARKLGIEEQFRQVLNSTQFQFGDISGDNVKKLYGEKLNLSASQIDRLAECRLSYFLKYGLRAKERKPVEIDPAEFGTYVHAVLEACGRKIVAEGGFKQISLESTLQLAAEASSRYFAEHFAQIQSERVSYHFHRNTQEVMLIVEELWNEMQQTQFQATDFEVFFGEQGQMKAIQIPASRMQAQLGGFVDRVDVWHTDKQNYFRIVDYKTGAKDFDYCDVYNGIGLQMLLYLYALEDEGTSLLGDDPISAGVLYFPARVPYLSADGVLSDEEAQAQRRKQWKRKGLILQEENVLDAMDSEESGRMPYVRRKDGSLSGDLASRKQFKLLKRYVFALLSQMVDEIASGTVEPNPYTRGSSHNACTFCPYGAVCHPEIVSGRRDYRAIKADEFWQQIEKEVDLNG